MASLLEADLRFFPTMASSIQARGEEAEEEEGSILFLVETSWVRGGFCFWWEMKNLS